MKKIISLLLISIFIITLAPAVFADGEVAIISPEDGSIISSLDEILVSADASVMEVIFEFDGKVIEKKSESGEISFSAAFLSFGVFCFRSRFFVDFNSTPYILFYNFSGKAI